MQPFTRKTFLPAATINIHKTTRKLRWKNAAIFQADDKWIKEVNT